MVECAAHALPHSSTVRPAAYKPSYRCCLADCQKADCAEVTRRSQDRHLRATLRPDLVRY